MIYLIQEIKSGYYWTGKAKTTNLCAIHAKKFDSLARAMRAKKRLEKEYGAVLQIECFETLIEGWL